MTGIATSPARNTRATIVAVDLAFTMLAQSATQLRVLSEPPTTTARYWQSTSLACSESLERQFDDGATAEVSIGGKQQPL
tara:strand:- start:596 stop:835 length:240 start_codon:yes stop_codon:yes gene_type:complete